MKRNNKVYFYLTAEEKAKLQEVAEGLGYSLTQYCRIVLLSVRPEIVIKP